jgi:hypothetical protein
VKPVDDKCFVAKVYRSREELPQPDVLSESESVLISDPVEWEVEFRAFVLNEEVVAISPYLREGELAETESGDWSSSPAETGSAIEYCLRVPKDPDVSRPPAFVMDIGIIKGFGWAVIEANAAWGSGLYGCDVEQALLVIRHSCVSGRPIDQAERTWLRDCPS